MVVLMALITTGCQKEAPLLPDNSEERAWVRYAWDDQTITVFEDDGLEDVRLTCSTESSFNQHLSLDLRAFHLEQDELGNHWKNLRVFFSSTAIDPESELYASYGQITASRHLNEHAVFEAKGLVPEVWLEVTQFDLAAQRASGTFGGILWDEVSESYMTISNGHFKNIPFTIE